MKTITPEQQTSLLGLLLLFASLEEQEFTIGRAICKILGERMLTDYPDRVSDVLFGMDGSPQMKLEKLLKFYKVDVVEPAPVISYPEFYAYSVLEKARCWLREFGKDETLETHYLTANLARIPSFVNWVNNTNPLVAAREYLEDANLQLEHRDIVMAALQGGFNPEG